MLQFGCVSGGDFGAMGMHFVKGPLVGDGEVDVDTSRDCALRAAAERPTAVDRRRLPRAGRRLGARTLGTAELNGQLFHLFDSPNRFGLPAFYTLHVWAWKDNPNGTFTNWNPNVSCNAFNPDQHRHDPRRGSQQPISSDRSTDVRIGLLRDA